MGLLGMLFGSSSKQGMDSVQKNRFVSGNPTSLPLTEEQKVKAARGRDLKGKDLESAGVNLKQFTPAKLRKDASRVVNEFGTFDISPQTKQEGYQIDPSNLTKAGKVPKCVANCRIHYDLPGGKMLACHGMKYKADGTLYSMAFNEWINHTTTLYEVREQGGKLVLTFKSVEDMEEGHVKVLYRQGG